MKRARSLVVVGACVALAVTACTSSSDSGGGDDGASGAITVWTHQNKSFNRAYDELAAQYMDENPGASITFEHFDYDSYIQTLQTALPAGNEADVLQMFGSWTCSYASNLAQVPDSVMTLGAAQEQYFKGPLGGYTCDDSLYGLPQESNIEYGATLLNTAMAEQAGVTANGWESFDDFKADAKAMTQVEDGEITRAGYHFTTNDGLAYSLLSLILQSGGSYLEDGTFTFNTPEGQQALALMKSFVDEGIVDPTIYTDTANWVGDCYFTELCAAGLVGPWVVPEYAEDFPEVTADTVYVPLPTLDNPSFAADSGWGLTVSSNTEASDLAWDFVSFVAANDSNALSWNLQTGTLPALRANTKGEARAQILAEAAYVEPFLDILGNAEYVGSLSDRDRLFYKIMVPHALAALSGRESIEDALAAMDREANAL